MTFGLGGIAEAFGDRNFRWYSLGLVVSWLSFFVQAVAVSWTAWDLTHSTAWLAVVALADATANIVLMPIGGVLADRGDRLRILMISYACATAQAAALTGMALSGALTIHALAEGLRDAAQAERHDELRDPRAVRGAFPALTPPPAAPPASAP